MVIAPLPSVELHPFAQDLSLLSLCVFFLCLGVHRVDSSVFSGLSISRTASCFLYFFGPEYHLYPKFKVCRAKRTNVVSACNLLRNYFIIGVQRITHLEQGSWESIDSLALGVVNLFSM